MQGLPAECKRVGVMCQGNSRYCQGNVWKWVQSARWNEGESQGNEREWVQSTRGMQGMQGNAR